MDVNGDMTPLNQEFFLISFKKSVNTFHSKTVDLILKKPKEIQQEFSFIKF